MGKNDFKKGKQEDNHDTTLNLVHNTAYLLVLTPKGKEKLWFTFRSRRTNKQGRHCTYDVTLWRFRVIFIPPLLS
jgi:hypothetical protein